MKKFLAVLLAVIMASMIGVSAFAVSMPAFPKQSDNMIYLAAESMYVEAGGTYTVPVYVVSNYTQLDLEEGATGTVNFKFDCALSGGAASYATIEAAPAEGITEGELGGYNANLSALQQEKMAIAMLTVTVSEDFPGGELEIIVDINNPVVTAVVDGEILPTVKVIPEGSVETVSAHLYEKPHWTYILHNWVKESCLTVVNFFLMIFQAIGNLI